MSIKLLDCTLRDGSHINQGRFGRKSIKSIIIGLVQSNIDLIEIGFLEDGSYSEDQTFFNDLEDVNLLLKDIDKNNSELGLMLRTDRCQRSKLKKIDSLDFVRIAFYMEHLEEVKEYTTILKNMEYKVYLNPIAVSKYSEDEINQILDTINLINPHGVSIVDTFGSLNMQTFNKVLQIFLNRLNPDIKIGIHLHENLSLSLALSTFVCETVTNRDLIIDSSIQGMGRVPGNLPTELISSYLNQNYNKDIQIDIIVDLAQKHIEKFKEMDEWGYNPIYMYSAMLNIDRSYPEYFHKKGFMNIDNIRMLKMIKEYNYGNKFNSRYADDIIEKFKS